jgi:recombinational DNA repair ATPase RecF
MKILELDIKNIRGIKTFHHVLEGKNIVVFGPNGTGKSAIVDAVDFLLRGDISRLSGKGSGCLHLGEHGCHVDSRDNLKDTVVSAKVEVDGKEIHIERSISKPSSLKVSPKKEKDLVESCLGVAELGQHVLSRREIVKYITSEGSERAKDIQNLLNLMEIEKLRESFVTIKNRAGDDFTYKDSGFEVAKKNVSNLLSIPDVTDQSCLQKVNDLRLILKGVPLAEIDEKKFKEGLPVNFAGISGSALTKEQIENEIKAVRVFLAKIAELEKKETELKGLIDEVMKDAKLKLYSIYKKLFEAGVTLAGDSNICPLCGREWGEGDFKNFLEERQKETEIGKDKQHRIDEVSLYIKTQAELIKNSVNNLVMAAGQLKAQIISDEELKTFYNLLDSWSAAMLKPLELYEQKKFPASLLKDVLIQEILLKKLVIPVEGALKIAGEKPSKELDAWSTLSKLEILWKAFFDASQNRDAAELFKKRADACLDYFETARNSVLEGIYNEVKNKFDKYYKAIHEEDEKDFASKFSHVGPALIFEVDFYGRGMFPPHALHSEGHQDSMGLCLFFALNEYLTKDMIRVIILDDVVMSIDRNHRKSICSFLKKYFENKQFIITTHDTAWAKQLKSEGVVSSKHMIHFLNWNIDVGPTYRLEHDLWQKIKEDLDKDDVPSAAQKLRRNAECFFEDICDLLNAKVPYKGTHQWELGDFASSAIAAYKDYIKRAKASFNRLGQKDKIKEINELETKVDGVIEKSKIEQWAINESVHYNAWTELGRKDFEPVVTAFKDLFALFSCPSCGQTISITYGKGKTPRTVVSCNCGKICWNM